MDTHDWKEHHLHTKAQKRKRLDNEKEVIKNFCEEYSFEYRFIQPWHIRVYGNNCSIDIFPMKKRFQNLKTNRWGSYKNIYEHLDKIFKVDSYGTK